MENSKLFWLLMRIEIPEVMGSLGMEHPDDPIGFMPVFATEAAALAHAGGVFAVHAIRLATPPEPLEARGVAGSPIPSGTAKPA